MPEHDPGPSLVFHPSARRVVRFDAFRFDLTDGSLWRNAEEVRVPPRALTLLQYLVERAGRVVSKQALMDVAWRDAHVSETSLTEAMGVLRQLLGDDAQRPRFIQTVHRRGYRFIAVVSLDEAGTRTPPISLARGPGAADEPGPDGAVSVPALSPAPGAPAPRLRRISAVWAGALAFALTSAGAAWWLGRPAVRASVTRASITLPADQAPAPGLNAHPVFAVSPDGQQIVYVAGSTGSYQLYLRRLDQYVATPIPGTRGAHGPFISRNGEWLAFFGDGALKKLRLPADDPVTLAPAPGGYGGTWVDDRTIVFAPQAVGPLYRISADGGSPEAVGSPPAQTGYRWPHAGGDGDTLIATRWTGTLQNAAVVAISMASGKETTIATGASFGRWVPTGHVVHVTEGSLRSQPFPGRAHAEPAAIADRVMTGATGAAQFAFAGNGTLVYLPDTPDRSRRILSIVSDAGHAADLPSPGRAYQNVAVCGDRLAASVSDRGTSDIWVGHVRRAAWTRLAEGGTNIEPVWLPDCQQLTFGSSRSGIVSVYRQRVDGGDAAAPVLAGDRPQAPGSWSGDGQRLAFVQIDPVTRSDIWIFDAKTARPMPLVRTPAQESAPRFSPDGRWLAYQSDETGRPQIFVRSLDHGGRAQVSVDGGTLPAWARDGSLLFQHQDTIWRVPPPNGSGPTGDPERVYHHPDLVLFRPLDSGLLVVRRTAEHLPLTEWKLVIGWF